MTIIYIYRNVTLIDKVYRNKTTWTLKTLFMFLHNFLYDYDEAKMQWLEEHDQLMEYILL